MVGGTSRGVGVFAAALASGVLGSAGAAIFGGGGAITAAGGTIFGGGLIAGTEGLATLIRCFAGFGAFRAARFGVRVFGFVAFAVPRAAGDSFGAVNRDLGIVAGGVFNGPRVALRFAGLTGIGAFAGGRATGSRSGAGSGVFWISPLFGVAAERGDVRAAGPS